MSKRCSVIDLGAGVGRLANPLAARGHRVVAVDHCADMLTHVHGPTPVLADVWSLDLGDRFDVVLALSHLINNPSRGRRSQLLAVCRRHAGDNGKVIIQRHPPTWVPREGQGAIDAVTIQLHDIERNGDHFSAATTYILHGRSWTQRWQAAIVDDAELAALGESCGLIVDTQLDRAGAWVSLSPHEGRRTSARAIR